MSLWSSCLHQAPFVVSFLSQQGFLIDINSFLQRCSSIQYEKEREKEKRDQGQTGRGDGRRYMLVCVWERERERERIGGVLTWNGSFCSFRWVYINRRVKWGDGGKYGPLLSFCLLLSIRPFPSPCLPFPPHLTFLENSRVPLRYLPKRFSKPLDVHDNILAIHFKFEIKISLPVEGRTGGILSSSLSTILGLNKINMR